MLCYILFRDLAGLLVFVRIDIIWFIMLLMLYIIQRFGRLIGLCKDPIRGSIWAFTPQSVFKYKVTREDRYSMIQWTLFCPPLKKAGYIALKMSVVLSVSWSSTPCTTPTIVTTNNSRTFCTRSFKLGRKIVLEEKMITLNIEVSRSKVKSILIYFEGGHKCFTKVSFPLHVRLTG